MGQSAEFGQFLRVMRARMSPEAAGLPTTSTARRVPGLRREEVAQQAGVSTDYYTRLEQGRQIRPSRAVVDAVARALQPDATERAHMLDLLHNCPPSADPVRIGREATSRASSIPVPIGSCQLSRGWLRGGVPH